jgi:hypothetical protein
MAFVGTELCHFGPEHSRHTDLGLDLTPPSSHHLGIPDLVLRRHTNQLEKCWHPD